MAEWVSRRYRRVGSFSRGRSIRNACFIANSLKAPSKASRERCGGQGNSVFLEAFALSRETGPLGLCNAQNLSENIKSDYKTLLSMRRRGEAQERQRFRRL